MYLIKQKSLSLNNIDSVNKTISNCIPPLPYGKTLSMSNMDSVNKTIFNCVPPLSYGNLLADKQFITKKLRQYIIKRYYSKLVNKNKIINYIK